MSIADEWAIDHGGDVARMLTIKENKETMGNTIKKQTCAEGRIETILWAISKTLACVGAFLLMALCAVTLVSIIGRALFNASLMGDVELTQIACALAIPMFLPYAQMKNAHVIVDFFTHKLPSKYCALLDRLAAVLLGLISFLLAYRSVMAMMNTYQYKTSTMILAWPEWIAHISIAPSFVLLGLTAFYTATGKITPLNKERS